jgi:ATP-dependent RNA helicase RhlE
LELRIEFRYKVFSSNQFTKDTMIKNFSDLHLIPPLLAALEKEGYSEPTPIQAQAIPHLLKGEDLLACAQTGTGKTAAFALPILQNLFTRPRPPGHLETRVLILTPTRELAIQIADSFAAYGRGLGMKTVVVFGGVGQNPQAMGIKRGADIIVATPGRLLDLINQRLLRLSGLDVFVLDEADRMLDMGFINDIKKILRLLPVKRQNLFFSATMPREIEALANSILKNPVKIEVTPPATTVERIDQKVMFVDQKRKIELLRYMLTRDQNISRVLVFTRTKHGANKVVEKLLAAQVSSEAIHGNKSQTARVKALENFRAGRTRVLVATDIAARGIDVDGISHVINFELPNVPESYVHRIGRTARAGRSGDAVSFCSRDERGFLRDIERTIRLKIAVDDTHPFPEGSQSQEPPSPSRPQQHQNHRNSRKPQQRDGQPQVRTQSGFQAKRSSKPYGFARKHT